MINLDFNSLSGVGVGELTLDRLLTALLVLVVCLAAVRLLMGLFSRAAAKSRIDPTLQPFLLSALRIILYLLAALIVADKLGIPVTSLIAALSVAGLAISLAIQGALSNIAGGIMILITKPFVIDDYVEAGDISGTVNEIGLSYTKFLTPDNKTVYAPNSDIAAAKIINYTHMDKRRLEIKIGASYNTPVETVKQALLAAAARHPQILNTPPVFVNIFEYGESQIQYVLRAWVPTADYWTVYFALLEDVKAEFDAHGVEMTYPHVNVHIQE